MKNQFEVPTDYIKSLTTIGIALLSGQIFFGIVAYIIIKQNPIGAPDLTLVQLFMYLIPFMMFVFTLIGIILFNTKMSSIREMDLSQEKLNAYRAATVIRLAMLEVPAFVSFMAVIATHIVYFYAGAGIMILVFAAVLPNRNKILSDLGI